MEGLTNLNWKLLLSPVRWCWLGYWGMGTDSQLTSLEKPSLVRFTFNYDWSTALLNINSPDTGNSYNRHVRYNYRSFDEHKNIPSDMSVRLFVKQRFQSKCQKRSCVAPARLAGINGDSEKQGEATTDNALPHSTNEPNTRKLCVYGQH